MKPKLHKKPCSDVKLGEHILSSMNKEDTLDCRLCGETRPAFEIMKNGGACDYCFLAVERADIYRTRQHPDEN